MIEVVVCTVGLVLSVAGVLLELQEFHIVGAVVTAVGLGMVVLRWITNRSH